MDERFISPRGTEALCENVVNSSYEDLSEDNIRIFKDRLLDMVGCIFGGAIVEENGFLPRSVRDTRRLRPLRTAERFLASRKIYHGYYSNPFVRRNHLNARFA